MRLDFALYPYFLQVSGAIWSRMILALGQMLSPLAACTQKNSRANLGAAPLIF